MLGDRVGEGAGNDLVPMHGSDVDDGARALRQHRRQHGTGDIPSALEIQGQASIPVGIAQGKWFRKHIGAGVVHQRVDASMPCKDLRDCSRHGVAIGHVRDHVGEAVAGLRGGIAIQADHLRAVFGEQPRGRESNAAGGTGDDGDLAVQAAAHAAVPMGHCRGRPRACAWLLSCRAMGPPPARSKRCGSASGPKGAVVAGR